LNEGDDLWNDPDLVPPIAVPAEDDEEEDGIIDPRPRPLMGDDDSYHF